MGETKKDALRVNFDRKLKLEFHGAKVTSDAGKVSQNRSQGRKPCPLCNVSDGRGVGVEVFVP